jgi:hypothetical protein
MSDPLTQKERHEIIVAACGGPDAWAAYIAASEALRAFARHVPRSLGLNVADIYKDMGERLSEALAAEERRRGI